MSSSNRPALIIAFCLCFFILATVYYSIDSSYTQQSFRTTYKHTSDPHGSTSDSYYYDRKYGKDSSHYEQEYMDSRIENVRNQTLGFGKVYAVSMASRSDRRDAMALASTATGFDITFMDGIKGDDIPGKALPPHAAEWMNSGTKGAWRTHANILREIVQSGIGSALIFEEDVDWDVRLKDQLEQVAYATRALVQPLENPRSSHSHTTYGHSSSHNASAEVYYDPSYPHGDDDILSEPMVLGDLPKTKEPKTSPYGDGWDTIFFGHCGLVSPRFPNPDLNEDLRRWTPKGHVMIQNDPTVPEPHYIAHVDEVNYPSIKQWPEGVNHTRVVHHAEKFICTHGFAISQEGARKMLHYVGIRALDGPFDGMVERYCQDQDLRPYRGACLGVQPAMFAQWRPRGDISKDFEIESPWFVDHHGEEREKGFDYNLRYSAMMNLRKLVNHRTDFEDQYPDTVKTTYGEYS